ncbi:MAG: toll/interleukin-1 receptor domain-containing protein, partial [Clostridia bacterium]|nr:toll/interleukin-1 receptor domain-containing protein [Clostridia bacterium]
MQSGTGYARDKDKKKATGVSLSYNHVNIEKKTEPRNIAAALFTIDESVADVATESFIIPVRNADNVTVYYKPEKGKGVCTPDTVYDKTQDDKIINLSAPAATATPTNKGGLSNITIDTDKLVTNKTSADEKDGGFGQVLGNILSVIGTVIGVILSIVFRLLWLGIIIFVILLVANKKFRNNVHIKILSSKYGPSFEKLTVKVGAFIKMLTTTVSKAKGNADLNGKFIFISHASADWNMANNRIDKVVCALEERGVKCWMSENGIKAGENYAAVLSEAIRKCTMMIVFISPSSAASVDVGNEVSMASEYRKIVVPVQITDFDLFGKFPQWDYHLRQKQKTNLFSNDEQAVAELADHIAAIYNEQ